MKSPLIFFAFFPLLINAQSGLKTWTVPGMGVSGPYSHAVEANGFLFLSGVIPVNYQTGEADTMSIQLATHRIFRNIREILTYCGSSLDSVVKVTVYLRDMNDFADMNEAYQTWFKTNLPARSTVAVREIPKNMPVEIEVVAIKNQP